MSPTVSDAYFAPKQFEKNGTIYKLLGVHIFKRFLPTFGDYAIRITGVSLLKGYSASELKNYEVLTRIYETIHLVAGILYLVFLPFSLISCSANLVINFYPIMVQRYNRARVYKILQRRGLRC